jgi:hypothetical protein
MLHQSTTPELAQSMPVHGERASRRTPKPLLPRPLLPRTLKEAIHLAELISKSRLAPKGFDTPDTCLIGILYGMEMGLSPIAALQRMAIIDGRPTLWGDAALALVYASGLCQSIVEDVRPEILGSDEKLNTGYVAVCTVIRAGQRDPVIRSFSTRDARQAGLWQKPGPWSEYPKRMLAMRARAFALRDAFPDVLAGLYIREELDTASVASDRGFVTDEIRTPDASLSAGNTINPAHAINTVNPTSSLPEHSITSSRAPPPPPFPDTQLEEPFETPPPSTDHTPTDHLAEVARHHQTAPDLLLEDFDSALCCAFDTETLEEIQDEFQHKIAGCDREVITRAEMIFQTHAGRVKKLEAEGRPQPLLDKPNTRSTSLNKNPPKSWPLGRLKNVNQRGLPNARHLNIRQRIKVSNSKISSSDNTSDQSQEISTDRHLDQLPAPLIPVLPINTQNTFPPYGHAP